MGDDVPDGEDGPRDGGDGSGVSDGSGDSTGGVDTGTDSGPFDPVTETTGRDAHPVTPTSTAAAHATAIRKRIPL